MRGNPRAVISWNTSEIFYKCVKIYELVADNAPDEKMTFSISNTTDKATKVCGSLRADNGTMIFSCLPLIENLKPFQTVEFSTDEQKIEGFGLMQKKDPESGAHTQI